MSELVKEASALALIDELRKRGAVEVSVPGSSGQIVAKFASVDPTLAPKAEPRKPKTKEEEQAEHDAILFGST